MPRLQQSQLSFESVDKVRDILSAILRTAVEYGRLLTNPADKVRLRRRKARGPKPFLRVDQFYALLAAIAEPYATMIYVAVFNALRVSELAGPVAEQSTPPRSPSRSAIAAAISISQSPQPAGPPFPLTATCSKESLS